MEASKPNLILPIENEHESLPKQVGDALVNEFVSYAFQKMVDPTIEFIIDAIQGGLHCPNFSGREQARIFSTKFIGSKVFSITQTVISLENQTRYLLKRRQTKDWKGTKSDKLPTDWPYVISPCQIAVVPREGTSTLGAVVYDLNLHGKALDKVVILGWVNPKSIFYRNKSFIKIMDTAVYEATSWEVIEDWISNSDYDCQSIGPKLSAQTRTEKGNYIFVAGAIYESAKKDKFEPWDKDYFRSATISGVELKSEL